MEAESKAVVCPYDKGHIIHKDRFVRHILKCAKRFPPKYRETCPFNARHIMTRAELDEHIEICPDKMTFLPKPEPAGKFIPINDDMSISDIDDGNSLTSNDLSIYRNISSTESFQQPKLMCRPYCLKQAAESTSESEYNESDTKSSILLPFGRGVGSRQATSSKLPAFGRGSRP